MRRLLHAAAVANVLLAMHTVINARLLRRTPRDGAANELVSVLVPARDEVGRIGACVAAVLASTDVSLELIVLDDGSTDGTADAARAAAGDDDRVRVIVGAEPPDGWLGKPHACARLALHAAGSVLVFLDADVVVAPDGIARTVALLRAAGLDLVSPYPRQVVDSPAERLVQPLLQWSWLTFLPLRLAEISAAPSLTAANGQLLACDASAYRAAGGHASVRHEVVEDVALARAFKRAGLRATVADGTDIATCRMYDGWAELRDGYTKSLWSAFDSPARAGVAASVLAWLYLLPPAAWIGRRSRAGAIGYAAAVAGRAVAAQRTGGRPLDAAAHPASITLLLTLLGRSLHHRRTGQLRWKGRPL
jgi:hypothetical protein